MKIAQKELLNYEEDEPLKVSTNPTEQPKKSKVALEKNEQEMAELSMAINVGLLKQKLADINESAGAIEGKKFKLVNREWVNISVAEISDLYLEYRQLVEGMKDIKKKSDEALKYINEYEQGKDRKDKEKKPAGKKYFGLF